MYPLLPLAIAARDAGHDVVFATGADFLPTARKAGLEAVAAGIGIRDAFTAAMAGRVEQGWQLPESEVAPIRANVFGAELPSRFVADLGEVFERTRPDLVVYEAMNPGGAFAAQLAGIPAVCHGFGRVATSETTAGMTDRLADYAREIGVDGADFPGFGNPFLDICPESAQVPKFLETPNRRLLRPVGWNEPGDLPAGIADRDSGRPLIYLTLGTVMGDAPVLRTAVAGLSALDADILVATGPTVSIEALGEVPSNVRLTAWVPQAELLGHLDLIVHHGGSGSTLGSFGAGLPQLLLPQGADQFTNAEAVRELGVGDRLLGDEVTAEAVTAQARRLLTDSGVQAATARMAAEVAAMPSPAEVAETLPTLAGLTA